MKISKYNPFNVNRVTGKISEFAKNKPDRKLFNAVINLSCKVYDFIIDDSVSKDNKLNDSFIWQRDRGVDKSSKNRCTIFASYSLTGAIEDHVIYYLRQLSKVSDFIIFIADNEISSQEEILKISEYVNYAAFERHGGFDFGSWRKGLKYLIDKNILNSFNELVFANDSCYGPIYPLNPIFLEMNSKNCDFWGLVDSVDTRYHIQSFFMVFKKKVFTDSLFLDFFNDLPERMTWNEAVMCGELRLTEQLSQRFTSLTYKPGLCNNFKAVKGGNHNTTLWPVTCLNEGIPFIKVKAMSGKYGKELNEGISDSLNIIKEVNPELYELIIRDLLKRDTINKKHIEFDGISKNIQKLIEEKSVVSFDVFDTLLNRPFVAPTDLFISIERECNIPRFTEERIDAERRARDRYRNHEVTLDEIYNEISSEFKSCKELELNYEYRILYPNLYVRELYQQAVNGNKKIICISDMYLPSKFIRKVLLKNGYNNIDHIFVSCEYRETKGLGGLFNVVLDKLNISNDELIHFGDNPLSDCLVPEKLKISAYYIPKTIDWFIDAPSNLKYLYFFQNNLTVPASIHISLCSNYRRLESDSCSFWGDLGYCVAGPLILSYVNFISESALRSEIDKLFFVARDGYILKKIYEMYFKEHVKIDCEYVYLTRHAGLTALLDYFDEPTYLSAILDAAKNQIPEIVVNSSFESNKSTYNHYHRELEKWSEENRLNLMNHVITKAGDSSSIAIVDMTTGLMSSYRFAKILLKNRVKLGIFTGTFKENSDLEYVTLSERILDSSDDPMLKMSELLVSSSEAPILAIDSAGHPIYGINTGIKSDIYKDIKEGVMDYCADFIKFFGFNNHNMMSFQEWMNLSQNYIQHCNHVDLSYLSGVYDTPGADNSSIAVKFSDLIKSTRGH